MRRPTLLQRKFALGLLGRKASLVAAPEKRDQSGFDDIDSYFSPNKDVEPGKENKSDWRVTKTPLKSKTNSRLLQEVEKNEEKEEEYEEYTMPVLEDDYEYGESGEQQTLPQQENDEEEISFGAKVITSPLSNEKSEKAVAEENSPVATRAKVNKAKAPRKPKKSLVSPRLLAESGTEVDEEGIRRSKRNRIQPLEYWKNEKVVYGRRQSSGNQSPHPLIYVVGLPVIIDVIKAPDTSSAKKKPKHRKSKRSSSAPEAAGYQQSGLEVSAVVRNPEGLEETETLLAISGEKINGEAVPGAEFKIHTVFVEGEFMSAGMLLFPKPGVSKPSRNSSRHALAFHVIKGSFEVAVNRSSFVAGPGASFFVPRNNQYAIKNVGTCPGRLFFCHCRQ